ncbi:sn-glycerol-3-phosphate ABC transporter ATP-binding protein UgpC [Mollicutes bacterium LVI A0039]|nr:sn-glycerol-3-phosphate ABC transporter ATP-binding protein UgpC [Mollicutes bacterium LVI A0039]
MSYVDFNGIHKQYENADFYSVTDFNLQIEKGEFIVFVGPSGCGKSTTLRMLAGLEEISKGELSIDGTVVNDVHPKDRDIAMVFQNYALYPHMTVADNISFGLKIAKMPKDEIAEKVKWAADVLGLTEYLKRKPKDLSGGQRQRVALGRAIVRNPKVFLMDEPLSNLDAKLRVSMRNEITKLHRDLDATTVYVTHDQVEAMTMADRIVVLKDGIIQQVGTPMDLYNKPQNLFVAGFIGAPQMNFFNVTLAGSELTFEDGTKIAVPEGITKQLGENKDVVLGIRPEHVSIDKVALDSFPNQVMSEEIINLERMGNENHVFMKVGSSDVILKVPSRMTEGLGDKLSFMVDINKCHFFNRETEQRIF